MNITDHEITTAMISFGGSFAAALGKLFQLGDPQNQARLKAAFPEYWKDYADLVTRRRGLQAGRTQ